MSISGFYRCGYFSNTTTNQPSRNSISLVPRPLRRRERAWYTHLHGNWLQGVYSQSTCCALYGSFTERYTIISKYPSFWGVPWRMRKQCVPGTLSSYVGPGYEARIPWLWYKVFCSVGLILSVYIFSHHICFHLYYMCILASLLNQLITHITFVRITLQLVGQLQICTMSCMTTPSPSQILSRCNSRPGCHRMDSKGTCIFGLTGLKQRTHYPSSICMILPGWSGDDR